MKLEELKTWDELANYLNERVDYATSDMSKWHKSFTKKDHFNILMKQCMEWKGQDLPKKTILILIKNVRKDFDMDV
jgi:hypothetical protein